MDTSDFFDALTLQTDFDLLAEDSCYESLPDDWLVGVADIVGSTKAVAAGLYKTVNTVGASVISAQINGANGRAFPFVFGGDGAVFAFWANHREAAETALLAVQKWALTEFSMEVRIAIVSVAEIRKSGRDVQVARFQASNGVDYAMFSGGGAAWAENQMKAGKFKIPVPENVPLPDLTGLSCRWDTMSTRNGTILSVVVQPIDGADEQEYRNVMHEVVSLVDAVEQGGHPVGDEVPGISWPPAGLSLEAHASRGRRSLMLRKLQLGLITLIGWCIFKLKLTFQLKTGEFDTQHYAQQMGKNADYRKFEDGLKMTLDVDRKTREKLSNILEKALKNGVLKYGLFDQREAMMTCIVPSVTEDNHIHFVDGASGGYTQAANMMKSQ